VRLQTRGPFTTIGGFAIGPSEVHVKQAVLRVLVSVVVVWLAAPAFAANAPIRADHGMVVSQNAMSSRVGVEILEAGGNAVDAAVATAFALAVTHPTAGNIGGGGFLVYRPDEGDPVAYDFREVAPTASHPEMWLEEGEYSFQRHHMSHLSVGVPGTVAGLYVAWQDEGKLPWERLLQPAIALARDGITVTHGLADSLARALPRMRRYPASLAQYSKNGEPYQPGELLVQKDLAGSLQRIADKGPDGFYKGRTAELIVAEMERGGGLITLDDLAGYRPQRREPVRGNYRGYEILSMPPPSSGGTILVEMLNILEGYDLAQLGFGTRATLHRMTEAMRRAYADRARFLGDPDFNPDLPVTRLTSKEYAEELRASIDPEVASISRPDEFAWPVESAETTHVSIVDAERNAVALTYTLEWGYGSGIVVPGGGFLLNNEMGDFNAGPGLTNDQGLIGTPANLAEPGKRMLSSMTPTILAREGELFMITGTPGGRTIINTVLQTILNVVDHGMSAQAAVDAGRIHHQWLPDAVYYEEHGFSLDSLNGLRSMGHRLEKSDRHGAAEVIVVDRELEVLEGGVDLRVPDGGAIGY
jgi:gamma-glutamyltranspeptidase/glutathione hydrolase